MASKRKGNTTGIRVKFIPCTNTKPTRLKITQMNANKSVTISQPNNLELIDYVCLVLDGAREIESYSLLVDNTQNDSYIFNVDFCGNSFDNILNYFKK